ncbi:MULTISPECIES: hypothetical protein [Corynebacterium]|uniref:hypothetical protein n=1 Tax=Corynebacterium TaxID=1716 RepID=UPI00257F0108|nr:MULTISPECIES: hypothetical protein [Corynebacterium]
MSAIDSMIWAASQAHVSVLAQAAQQGPMGPEFGKASPIGLLVLALMAAVVLFAGWNFHRRYSRFRRRTLFAQNHGIDPFDDAAIDAAMKEAGIYDRRKRSLL